LTIFGLVKRFKSGSKPVQKSRHKTQKFCTFILVKGVNFPQVFYPFCFTLDFLKPAFYPPFSSLIFSYFFLRFPFFFTFLSIPIFLLLPPTYLLHSFFLYSHDLSMIKLKIKIRVTWQAVLFTKVETKTMV